MRFKALLLILLASGALTGCRTIEGYPRDPEQAAKTLNAFATSFDGTDESDYYKQGLDDARRSDTRNAIIARRLHGYDIAYASFERQLLGAGNTLSTGADLVGLALGGLTATVGGAGTKAALGAVSAGVLGANAAVNRDLFYQKTVPALVSEMDVNRAKVLLVILQGMKQSDSAYPLAGALADLNRYRDAGSLPNAITAVTQTASEAKQTAEDAVSATFVRGADYWTNLPTSESIEDKLQTLSDPQLLVVMKAMDATLSSRPTNLQKMINSAPTRETDAKIAKTVLSMWGLNDDMTADHATEWMGAIAAAIGEAPISPGH